MSVIKDIYNLIESYVNKSDKVIKVINWCKSVICLFFISYFIDSIFSYNPIDIGHIYANDRFNYYCFNIFNVASRLFFSLCLFSFIMVIIFSFNYYHYSKMCDKVRIKNIKPYVTGSYLRLVNALEYFYIFFFITSLFNRDFVFEFINAYWFSSFAFTLIFVVSFILLIPSIVIKVMMPFFKLQTTEKNDVDNDNDEGFLMPIEEKDETKNTLNEKPNIKVFIK